MNKLQRMLGFILILVISTGLVLAQSNGDYQTAKSGNWNDASVWQTFNGGWAAAAASPDVSTDSITVHPGHIIHVTSDLTIDDVLVTDGGSVVVDAGVTLTINFNEDGPGLDLNGIDALVVFGNVKIEGNINAATVPRNVDFDPAEDTLVVKTGGTLEFAREGGRVPICKWEENSTFLMTGIMNSEPQSQPQNYWHIVWDCASAGTRWGRARINFYRNRIRGNFTVLRNGRGGTGDRDIRMCDEFPAFQDPAGLISVYEDTVWFDGNIHLKTPVTPGDYSRVAISGGGNTLPVYVLIVKGNITIEDSCVFGRTNSQGEARVELYGDLTIKPGGTLRTFENNPWQQKYIWFKKQGEQKFTVEDGPGLGEYGYQVGGSYGFRIASGCTLNIGKSKIGDEGNLTGFFVIDEGGALKVEYENGDCGMIYSTGEKGIISADRDTLDGVATVNGNSFAITENVTGTGDILFSASAIQNVNDPAQVYAYQFTVEPSGDIQSGDLILGVSEYDIPSTVDWKRNFVSMKYSGSGSSWTERGPADLILDDVWGDVLGIRGAKLTNISDLGGVWSMGNQSATGIEIAAAGIPREFYVEQNYPNPFNPSTSIAFGIPRAADVSVKAYNTLGQEVLILFQGHKQAGSYEISFDASNLVSGVYLVRVEAGESVDVKRITLIK